MDGRYSLLTIGIQGKEVIKDNETGEDIDPNKALLMILEDLKMLRNTLLDDL